MVQTSNSFELLTGTDSDHDHDQTNKPTKTTEITEPNTESQYSPTTNKEDPESKKNENDTPKKVDPPNHHKPINAETIILCDSNGRYLKPELLCPNSSTHYTRCPTLTKAENIMKNTHFSNPKCFILHCGTNYQEKTESDQELITLIENIVKLISDQYPNCRIIISGLLPRKDHLNENITIINNKLENILTNKANVSFIQHNNIKPTEDLKDKKHLNQKGVKFFAKNIKATYFNTTPKKKTS
jgi:hypothetical protein